MSVTWTAAWDNTAVTSYKVFRNGVQIGTTAGTSYSDNGLVAGTSYSYQISALDAAANESNRSVSAAGRTLGVGDRSPGPLMEAIPARRISTQTGRTSPATRR